MQSSRTFFSAAAEAIANMKEILTEILVSVPARSLVRFKCVSKHWYSLISNPKFCHRHTLQNSNPNISAFLFVGKIEHESSLDCIRLGTHANVSGNPFIALSGLGLKVVQSCNGLFLCVPRFYERGLHDPIYVINPTTNQFLALSCPKGEVGNFVRYALAFDPSKSSHYKVVCLSSNEIEIYSSETRTWRLLEISLPSSLDNFGFGTISTMENGVYCNGTIHWMTDIFKSRFSYDEGGNLVTDSHLLYYYDMSEECMGVAGHIPTGESYDSFPHYIRRYFGESSGHLYLIDIYRDSETQFDVMGMTRDFSGWFVRYHVDLNLVNIGLHNSYLYVLFPGKEEDHQEHERRASSVLFIPRCHTIISPKHGKGRRKRNKTFEISLEGSVVLDQGYYYMETLAPVM
ncbi:F-box protein At5g07610-like [Argentina anserina]|uniref:F-box protein At5g07610-like n=1 Tax=Argentina anserina TaxID=57926 RepID=UPI00217636CE|nr:F-box protein At5g07610-like [Potentilla anserina]